jgi:hypothetical protein
MDAGKVFDELLAGTISRSHQVDKRGVHLTVAEVIPMHGRGDVDFAGSEMKPARGNPAEPIEHMPGDPHGWWRLDAGTYLVRFNEKLKDGAPPMMLIANDRLLACGCSLAAACVGPGELRSVMTVPHVGLRIKQNARIGLLVTG